MGGEARKIKRLRKAALSNPLIAERILNQAEFEDKKNIRLVSKFWRDSTLAEWRQSVTLRLQLESDRFGSFGEEHPILTVKSFEEIVKGGAGAARELIRIHEIPFRRLYLDNIKSKYSDRTSFAEPFEEIINFLTRFGSTLEYLQLGWLRITQPFFENLLKFVILRACPKLKELEISDCLTWSPDKDSSIDYANLLNTFDLQPLHGEALNLTKLDITISEDLSDSPELLQFWEDIFSSLPNLKVLKYYPAKGSFRFPITGASRLPMTTFPNGKYLELEKLDLHFDLREASRYEEFRSLGTFLEITQPPLKKIRIALQFDCKEINGMTNATEMSNFHQFCKSHGHALTELEIQIEKNCWNSTSWVPSLTGHYFPNLTHFTIDCFHYHYSRCTPGKVNFDFEALKGMPKLQVFCCKAELAHGMWPHQYLRKLTPDMLFLNEVQPWRKGLELPESYQHPLELKELKEFEFRSSTDRFDVNSLRIVLGWMKGVEKLTLKLDKATFPIVFEMLPNLEKLTLLGMPDYDISPAEYETGVIWMEDVNRARQEKDWSNQLKRWCAKEDLGELEVLRREKEKEKRERRRAWLERKRVEMERQEKEWIRNQGEEGNGWNFVSYRKPEAFPHLLPRNSRLNKEYETNFDEMKELDDLSVFAQLLQPGCITNIFGFFDSESFVRSDNVWCPAKPIQYKVGGKREEVRMK